MTLNKETNMYNMNYDIINIELNTIDLNSKLFASFTNIEGLDNLIESITHKYSILYNKIFIFEVEGSDELIITYNVDCGNINTIPSNTILVHRKKDSNTLYTINALNRLIMSLNGGILNKNYKINWLDYKNSILLTQSNEFKKLNTKLYRIINL
jgi:hypothetical protein